MENSIFKNTESLKVNHKLSDKWFTIDIPLFENSTLRLKKDELDLASKCLQNHLDWFKKVGIRDETNFKKLCSFSLCDIFLTCQINGKPEEQKIRELFTSMGILLGLGDDILDDTEEGQAQLEEVYGNPAYFCNAMTAFLEDVTTGEYKGVEDLPEEALNFHPKLGQLIKCTQLRVDELKILKPDFKETYQHVFDEGSKIIQATYIMFINQKKRNLPIGLETELQEYLSTGTYFLEYGLAYFEYPLPHKIRNHVYFNRYKLLFREICAKINILFGLGGDFDDTDYGWVQNDILRKWSKDKPIEDLEPLVKIQENILREKLTEFHEVGELFVDLFPNNSEVEDLVDLGKDCYNNVLRAYYMSGRYTSKRKDEQDTKLEHWINGELQEIQTFSCKE